MSEFVEVSKIDELKDGMLKAVNVAGREILLAQIGKRYYAADNQCTHMGGKLAQGKLEGTVVTCPLHGSQFDLSRGQVVRWLKGGVTLNLFQGRVGKVFKPAKDLTVYNVKVEDGRVLIEI